MTSCYVLYDTYFERCLVWSIQTYSGIFTSCSDMQPYCGIFRNLCNSCQEYLFNILALAYSEPCHIQNPGIFRVQDITLWRHIPVYSRGCVTLAYWEPYHIKTFGIFRSLAYLGPDAYSESFLFRHIQPYSGTFNNNSYNNINFFFSL